MDIFAAIADERRDLADLLGDLGPGQRATPSLCGEWTVQEVVGHLVVPLEVGIPGFLLAMLRARGSFDRANVRLARQQAQRPWAELVDVLRRKADTRFTPPGSGPEAPLTDVLVHGLDVSWPLGLRRELRPERVRTSLDFLASPSARGLVPRGRLDGLRLEVPELTWAHGVGEPVVGDAEAVLLAMTGRREALESLRGDGVTTLRSRLG